jgi:transposase InsO family protein
MAAPAERQCPLEAGAGDPKKGRGVLRTTAAVQDAWIREQHAEGSVSRLWRTLEVSRSGYDARLGRPPRAQPDAEQQVEAKGQQYVAQGRGTYGTRRIKPLLAQEGLQGRRCRIGRVLAQAGLRGNTRRKFTAPTAALQAQPVAPHQRNRELTGQAPDPLYVGDITSLPTGAGGRALGSRAVVGWAMADPMRAELGHHALARASGQRPPTAGLLRHTDRGRQEGADSSRQLLAHHGRAPRRSRKGTCGDHAVAARCFHT